MIPRRQRRTPWTAPLARRRRCPARCSATEAGFSLIEVIVGLALLGLAIALLPAALRLASGLFNAEREIEQAGNLALGLQVVADRLAVALPIYETSPDGGVRFAFTGSSRSLSMVVASDTGPRGGGLYRWVLAPPVTAGDHQHASGLTLELWLHGAGPALSGDTVAGDGTPEATIEPPAERRLLLPASRTARFAYFGAQPTAEARPQWHEAWTRRDGLPLLIAITIEHPPQPARRIIVAPRLGVRP